MIEGVDVSAFQPGINFSMVRAHGKIKFICAKATEGFSYTDALYRSNHDGAKSAGILFGGYHFFHNEDGAAQAKHFLSAIAGYQGGMLPMVDCEVAEGSRENYIANLSAFLKTVDSTLKGKRTLIYFGWAFWRDFMGGYSGFSGHPAWVAAYNNDASLDMRGTGWKQWTLWQWSNGSGLAPVPGIPGGVDRDRLNPYLTLEAISR
jgi:lysozyme